MEETVMEKVCSNLWTELQRRLSNVSAMVTGDRGSWRCSGIVKLCLVCDAD